MKALVFENKVIQLNDITFPVHESMRWINCPNDTEVGWEVNGNTVVVPTITPVTVTLMQAKQNKLNELASYRYQKEVGGLTINGYFIATDDRSKTLLLGARMLADSAVANNVQFSIDWKTENGFQPVNAQTIITLSNAMSQFVQHCFTVEANHTAMINSLTTIQSVEAYSFTSGW